MKNFINRLLCLLFKHKFKRVRFDSWLGLKHSEHGGIDRICQRCNLHVKVYYRHRSKYCPESYWYDEWYEDEIPHLKMYERMPKGNTFETLKEFEQGLKDV